MPWKIRHFTFNEENQSLTAGGRVVQLEPLMAEVLGYLCRHPDVIVSRDDLIDAVWQSRAVTDNAVNRIIAKLRKVLGDDAKSPHFIATQPRKGYRFVAPAIQIEEGDEGTIVVPSESGEQGAQRTGVKEYRTARWATAMIVVAALFAATFLFMEPATHSTNIIGVTSITRGSAQELEPAVSRDGRFLAYSSPFEGQLKLFLKDLESETIVEIGGPEGDSGAPSWSASGHYLAYQFTTNTRCEVHLLSVTELTVTNRKSIHSCPKNSYGKLLFTHDDNRLLYSQASAAGPPYSIYELTIGTGESRRVAQPELFLGGNAQFDLHPYENKLLISSPDGEQWLAFYSLDLDTDQLSYLFRLNEFVCCAIWSTDGLRVVLIGEHPAYELISFDLHGKDRKTLYKGPHMISSPARFGEQGDYVFVGGTENRDIQLYRQQDWKRQTIVSSSVNDRLAVVDASGQTFAYISDRSDRDEVWLHDIARNISRKLTTSRDYSYYYDLAWAPNGQFLIVLAINELHLIDAKTGDKRKLDIAQGEIRGVSWKDENTIAFSVPVSGGWRVHYYDIVTNTIQKDNAGWHYIRYAFDCVDTLWFAATGEIFYGPEQEPLPPFSGESIIERGFGLSKHGTNLYHLEKHDDRWQLIKSDINSDMRESLLAINGLSTLSIHGGSIYFSELIDHSANIYRTIAN